MAIDHLGKNSILIHMIACGRFEGMQRGLADLGESLGSKREPSPEEET